MTDPPTEPDDVPVTLELVIKVRYNALPRHYGTDVPSEMAVVDTEGFNSDIDATLQLIAESEDVTIEVHPAHA